MKSIKFRIQNITIVEISSRCPVLDILYTISDIIKHHLYLFRLIKLMYDLYTK